MLNQIILMGRLTREPEFRYTQTQTPVASFSIACDRDEPGRDGERQTDFIDCVAWRQTAEFVGKYLHKGSLVALTGSLHLRDWTDKTGAKRRSAEITVTRCYFAEPRQSGAPRNVDASAFVDLPDEDDEEKPLPF